MNSSSPNNSKESEILNQLDEAIIELDNQGHFLFANTKAEQLFNRSANELLNRHIWTEFPAERNTLFYSSIEKALNEKIRVNEHAILKFINSFVSYIIIPSSDGIVVQIKEILNTDRATSWELQSQLNFSKQVTEMVPDIISITELPSLKIIYCNNESFILNGYDREELLQMSLKEREQLMHPEDLHLVKEYYKSFTAETKDEEIHTVHYRAKNKNEVFLNFVIRGKILERYEDGSVRTILNFIQNITEKEKAEQLLKENNLLIESILSTTPDFVTIQDAYTNQILYRNNNNFLNKLLGINIYELPLEERPYAIIDPEYIAKTKEFLESRKLIADDEIKEVELKLKSHGWIKIRSKVFKRDEKGNASQIISYTSDVTESKKAEQEIKTKQQLLQATMDSSPEMIQVFKAVRNKYNEIEDFIWVLNNHASETIYGDVIGKSLLANNPGVIEEGIFDSFKQVVETGIPQQYEKHYVHEQFDGWFLQSVVKLHDGIATTTIDITKLKKSQQELQQNEKLLQDIIDAPNIGIAVYRAVSNNKGEIVDFKHEYINRASNAMLGEDFTGKLLSDHGANGISQLQSFKEVLQSKEGNKYIREFHFQGHHAWFSITNTPLDDKRLVHTWENITESKNAEAEILRLKDEMTQKVSDKYYSIFNSIDDAFVIIDIIFENNIPIDFKYLEANPAFEKHSTRSNVINKTFREVAPNAENRWIEIFGQVALTGESVRFEEYSATVKRWANVTASRVGNNESTKVAVIFNNITKRKQQEQQQEYLLKLSDTLRRSTASPIFIEEAVTRMAMDYFGADRCYYCTIEGDNAIIRRDAAKADMPSVAGIYPLNSFAIFKKVIEEGRPFIVHDVHTSDILDEKLRSLCIQLQVISFINIPVIKNKKVVGVLCLVQSEPREWTEAEVQLANDTAEHTWAAVERAKVEEALKKSEEKYRNIFQTIDEGFALMELVRNKNGKVIDIIYREVNDAFKQFTGWRDAIGKSGRELMPNLDQSILDIMQSVADTGETYRKEDYVADLDLWYDVHYTCIGKPKSNFIVAVFKNNTERRRREESQQFLLNLSDGIRPFTNAIDIQKSAMEILAKQLNVIRASYYEIDTDQDEAIIVANYETVPLPVSSRFKITDFGTEIVDTYLKGQTIIIYDTEIDSSVSQRDACRAVGVRAWIGVPYTKNGKLLTVLGIHSSTPRRWSNHEVRIIEETAERLWSETQRAKVEIELRKSEEKYRTLFETIDEGFAIMKLIRDEQGQVVDLIYLEVNKAFERHTGLSNVTGKTLKATIPNYDPNYFKLYQRLVYTGKTSLTEFYVNDINRWLRAYHSRLGEQSSDLIVAVFEDITERKRNEQQKEILSQISNNLIEFNDIPSALEYLGEKIGKHFNVKWCTFTERNSDNETFTVSGWNTNDVTSLNGTLRLKDFLSDEQIQKDTSGEITIVNNTQTDPRTNAPNYALLNMMSYIMVPMISNGKCKFRLSIIDTSIRQWRQDEIELLKEIANRVWVRVEKARAEEAIRKSEERKEFLLKLSDALRVHSDARKIQQEAMRVLGEHLQTDRILYAEFDLTKNEYYIADNYVKPGVSKRIGRFSMNTFSSIMQSFMRGEIPVITDAQQTLTLSKEEKKAYLEMGVLAAIGVPLIKEGQLVAQLGAHHSTPREWTSEEINIIQETAERTWAAVERSKVEETLRINEDRTSKLKEAYQSAINGAALKESLNILAELVISETSGEVRMAYYLANEAVTHLNPIHGVGNMPESYLKAISNFAIGVDSIACGLAVPAGKPILTADVYEEPAWQPFIHLAKEFDYRGCWSFPIKTLENSALGTFSWYFRTNREATPNDLVLAEIIMQASAVIISYHINNEKRIQTKNELRNIADALRQSEQQLKEFNESLEIIVGERTEELKQSKELLHAIATSQTVSLNAFKAVRNANNEIVDLECTFSNPTTELYTNSKSIVGKKYLEIFSGFFYEEIVDIYRQVIETGVTHDAEFESMHNGIHRWFRRIAVKLGDGILVSAEDITERKHQEIELSKTNDKLKAIFEKGQMQLGYFTAIRNEEGTIIDYSIEEANPASDKQLNVPITISGYKLSQILEGVKGHPIWNRMNKTIETGEAQRFEEYLDFPMIKGWYDFSYIKLGDGIISQSLNITERKEVEQKIIETNHFIEEVTNTTPDIIYVFDRINKKVLYVNERASNIFGYTTQQLRDLNVSLFQYFCHPDDLEKRVKHVESFVDLKEGEIISLELRLKNSNGNYRWFRIRDKVFKKEENGDVVQTIGVGQDITEQKYAMEELVKLQLNQQKEILNTILNTQEEERKKIAESLHNGLGQLLYATKMRSESMKPDPNSVEHIKLKYEVDQQLEEAIDMTRDISRQLSPQFLESSGLVVAIEYIINKFKSDILYFTFKFISDKERFHPEIEISVYRIVQELINNIIKHSKASIANIRIESTDTTLTLTAKDDGNGFDVLQIHEKKTGMGLKMIENRVKLLNGTITIESHKETGTKTTVVLPL